MEENSTENIQDNLDNINSSKPENEYQNSVMLCPDENSGQKTTDLDEENTSMNSENENEERENEDQKKKQLKYVFRVINFGTGVSSEEVVTQSFVKLEPFSLNANGYQLGDRFFDTNNSHAQNRGLCTKENGKMNKKVHFNEDVDFCYKK